MTTMNEKTLKPKLGLLELAKQLGSVSQACKVMGYSRDSFFIDLVSGYIGLLGYLITTKFDIYIEQKFLQHNSLINLGVKLSGKRSAGNPHAAFDVAGVGNVTKGAGLRTAAKVAGNTPNPKEGAPALDPTFKEHTESYTHSNHNKQFHLHGDFSSSVSLSRSRKAATSDSGSAEIKSAEARLFSSKVRSADSTDCC